MDSVAADALERLERCYDATYDAPPDRRGHCTFRAQDAARCRLPHKVSLMVTSPPYPNRSEYYILYGPENHFLASVGYRVAETAVVGTAKVKDYVSTESDVREVELASSYAGEFLAHVRRSPEKDDVGYYLKYYARYFVSMLRIFDAAVENTMQNGRMLVAVQDNIHRGRLIELSKFVQDVLRRKGWRVVEDPLKTREWERHHLGLRNVSRKHAFVKPKHTERIVEFAR
jgi:hypothetical protein